VERVHDQYDRPGRTCVQVVKARRSRRLRSSVVILGLLACATLAGCGTAVVTPYPPAATQAPVASDAPSAADAATPEPTATPTATLPDPCKLLTQAEADQLAGIKLQGPLPEGDPPTNCAWPTPLTGPVAQVEVGVGDGAKKFLDTDKDVLAHDFAQVSGLGDEAWVEDDTVFVRVGDLWFSLHLVGYAGTSAYRPKLEALAKTIIGRL
jgi:hypothetical protein